MMNEQVACEGGAGGSSGLMMRRRSKDWILPHTPAVGVTATRNGESSVANTSSAGTTPALSSVAALNSNSSTQFMELIEMLFCCYLEHESPQRSEHYRNLVEVVLRPIFDHLETRNNRTSATARPPVTMNSGVTSVATPSRSAGTTMLMACPDVSPCNSRNGINLSVPTVGATGPMSPPTATVVVIPGVQNTVGMVGHSSTKNESETKSDLYSSLLCPVCYGIFVEPVTIQCGHSYCKKCLQKQVSSKSCRRCSYFLTSGEASQCKTNVLLGELVEKWWPDHVTASRLRSEGNRMFEEKQVENALAKYTQALNIVPGDHLSLGNRSNCLLNAGKSEEALRDAEAAIKSCPIWSKGYFRKSAALISLGRFKEAFLSLTVCMYLTKLNPFKKVYPSTSSSSPPTEDPARTQVINEMIKVLQKTFLQSASSAMGSTLKRHNVGSEKIQYTPYPGARSRGSAAFNRQDWNNSSDYNCIGDEGEHAVRSHNQQNHSRKSNKSHNHHPQYREQSAQRSSSSSSSVVEQLSAHMGRLFTRASQDLKSFDMRLRGDRGYTQGIKPILNVQPPREVSCTDVECSLCYRLLFQPVSTECGHTFCRSCLDRCMDHNPACPLCKTGLQSYLACREHAVTEFLEDAIKMFLPKEYEERLKQHMEELNSVANAEGRDVDVDVPIFVCTMAFPTIPCPLHVFEPRYRLMIRRCMENGSNRFGMCCYFSEGENNYGEIGTLLEIRNIQYFADGRSVVDTVGCRRFKVVHKNVVDGYNTAKIELLHDKSVTELEIPVVQDLHDQVLREATGWLQSIGQIRRQRIHSHFGTMPDPEEDWLGSPDGPSWIWWLLAILPLDSKAQLAILSMCSLQKRLECILKVLNFVKNRMGADRE